MTNQDPEWLREIRKEVKFHTAWVAENPLMNRSLDPEIQRQVLLDYVDRLREALG